MHVNNYMNNRGMGGQQNGVLPKHYPICIHAVQPLRAASQQASNSSNAPMPRAHALQCVMNKGDKYITCIIACHCTHQHATKLNALENLQKAGMQSQCNN